MELPVLRAYLAEYGTSLYAAALSPRASDLRDVPLSRAAVAVVSEGQGLSEALLAMCRGELIIPMNPQCESLNAAIAAAIIMWEMTRQKERV
jgi:TrmH family RNA methyltransferase